MMNPITRYTNWLHTKWPAGHVEKLPHANPDGSTNVPGVYLVGDLTGIPLLKFSADTGAKAVRTIVDDAAFARRETDDENILDLAIIGGGVSGMAAALEAKTHGLRFTVFESAEAFSTIANFPKAKPIYTYPTEMTPAGKLQFDDSCDVKETLLEALRERVNHAGIAPTIAMVEHVRRVAGGLIEVTLTGCDPIRAHRVIIAIGRSGNYRTLDVPGENREHIYNRLHDPAAFSGKKVVVIGGGDSALETAAALTQAGADVTLSYRKKELARAKPGHVELVHQLATTSPSSLRLILQSTVREIGEREVVIQNAEGDEERVPADAVFPMIGRDAPLDFFRRSGIRIRGEWRGSTWASFILAVLACIFIYHWKKSGVFFPVNEWFTQHGWFPFNVPAWWTTLGACFERPANILGALTISLGEPGFYYSLAYCLCVAGFGWKRIRLRRTPYVTMQTITLTTIQIIPLFFLPYLLLPWAGYNGWFDSGFLSTIADHLFPIVNYGHGREYWRAFGFVLAWPLFFWNVFTSQPMWAWLIISLIQTFIIIPLMIRRWGKGAYCGWICSCGALAETMGDAHRHKMPHGPIWNRLNMIGQVFLAFAFVLLFTRVASWVWPESVFHSVYDSVLHGAPALNYVWFVDLFFAGIIGVGFYWHFSGRVWCRFACPLAALMHIYTRWFSRFRIFVDQKKCISCNVCTTVCHQGIDIMSFANKGNAMEDPECVRCSACVQSCPTGVLTFGRIGRDGSAMFDTLAASPVQMAELTVRGQRIA